MAVRAASDDAYSYDRFTFRLAHLETSQLDAACRVSAIHDPASNITEIGTRRNRQ